jgi:hypothetical protein
MAYITKLAKDEAAHQTDVRNLKTWVPHLVQQRRRRAAALRDRWAARERVANQRDAFGRAATAKLREALSDLYVSLRYRRNAYSPEAADQIIQAMGWRTNQQARADWLVQDLTVPELLKVVDRRDPRPILALRTPEGVEKFRGEEANTITERLSEPTVRYALERVALHDLPRLQVTKMVPDGRGSQRPLIREFTKLSLGQQQSVLLCTHPLFGYK